MTSQSRACLAEFLATFMFVFIGVGAIAMNAKVGWGIGLIGIALAHGLGIAIGVNAIGHISGGHINPAVTLGMMATKRIGFGLGIGYIVSQLLGAALSVWVLKLTVPIALLTKTGFGTPQLAAGITPMMGGVIEAVLTFFLVLAIFGSAVDPKGPKSVAGFVIGLTVCMDIFVGGPLTGAAMNPARFFGPALVGGIWSGQLVYWIGPAVGAIIAAFIYDRLLLAKR